MEWYKKRWTETNVFGQSETGEKVRMTQATVTERTALSPGVAVKDRAGPEKKKGGGARRRVPN
jgi:hypothetical protein